MTSTTHSSWDPEVITHKGRVYKLRAPLPCSVEQDHKVYSIENPMLSIIGTGADMDEAEKSFMQEFDFIYRRYTALPDQNLAAQLVEVKRLLKLLVTEIQE